MNRLTAIEHKDGTTVLDGFYYDLDAVGNITSTTHEDGAFWDYAYDGRYRLTSAVRSNPNETIEAAYSYTYDAGDNLLTKVEPFEDDFNDGNATGWAVTSGTWQASGNYLEPTHASNWNGIKQSTTDADNEVRLRYRINDTSNGSAALVVRGRYVDDNNLVQVAVRPGSVALEQIAGGTPATLDSESAASTQDAWYNLRIESDGGDVTVWRWADGDMETKVLETASASVTTANAVMLGADAAFAVDFDDVRILADGLSNTTTFAVNNANELTSMADRNGSTTFGFDAWGRMTSKARGSYTAAYGYRYGQMLCSVDSDFPGEGDVTYEYGGDGKRRERTSDAYTTVSNWSSTHVVNIESENGALVRTCVGLVADVLGSSPASGAYRYVSLDGINSSRTLRADDKAQMGHSEFSSFGDSILQCGVAGDLRFGGLELDSVSTFYAATYRQYWGPMGRWTTREPTGADGPNLYTYVGNNPGGYVDPLGLKGLQVSFPVWPGFNLNINLGLNGDQLSGSLGLGAGNGIYGSYDPYDTGGSDACRHAGWMLGPYAELSGGYGFSSPIGGIGVYGQGGFGVSWGPNTFDINAIGNASIGIGPPGWGVSGEAGFWGNRDDEWWTGHPEVLPYANWRWGRSWSGGRGYSYTIGPKFCIQF
ncbi:MAG: hypothetical protein IT365_06415 [Candidatus Hydrogenedentes bacterium]|nr:hypothetical protein [Candidatus Hydrogenedentota bacterium]